jgi:hydrogenase 3 maturation protease
VAPKAVLGIGNPLRRDDGVGPWVAEQMQGSDWDVISAGPSVENSLGLVRRMAPDLLVVVDAAEMGLPPGSVRRLPVVEAERMLGSTHGLPLPFLLSTVRDRVGEIVLIGIQPADRSLGEGLTPEVYAGAEDLVAVLRHGHLEQIPAAPGRFTAERAESAEKSWGEDSPQRLTTKDTKGNARRTKETT